MGTASQAKPSSPYELRDHCGAFGIYSFSGEAVAHDIYYSLMNLQHRGQDSAGAAVADGKKISLIRKLGLVSEIFTEKAIRELPGFAGIGHVRYPTIGAGGAEDAQPFVEETKGRTFAIAHNGNIAAYGRIRKSMEAKGRKFSSTCDVELILAVFVEEYNKTQDYFAAAEGMMKRLDGGYSVVLVTDNGDLIALRDPQAIRPLCWGQNDEMFVFSSESVALDIIECELKGDLAPGEIVVVNKDGVKRKIASIASTPRHCMFEYVYFARPDSKMEGRWIDEVRGKLGESLARAAPVQADIIVPVPDTARSACVGYSRVSGIPVVEGLIKNRYIGRTFIMNSQKKRREAVKLKLNAVRHILQGKRVILVDDSIVRGTTAGPIVKLVRDAGAKEVHLRITCPPITGPCFYGVDIPSYTELIASKKSVEEIRRQTGADSLSYLSIDDLVSALGMKREHLCMGCLNGDYPTPFGKEISKKMREAGTKEGVRIWEEEV
ncbi:Glutamine--fructose-6-phosphate aminotransferase [isomerizing] [uncultured archaeon]|nr:Glutamine--fructose-6-phosphate aminotransferase [isomerizing] [uncultured archaeon]